MAAHSEFTVATSTGSYDVRLGDGQLRAAAAGADVVLVDAALAHLLPDLDVPVITLVASEDTKTLAGCEQVILQMREARVRRGHHVLAVGGGIVQDVATFVTDVYMRGLPWTYVPTTLMAMTDSCIGGKSSINVGDVKNLVGGIYPPDAVVVDPGFLPSLDATARNAGFAEAVKIAFCRGPEAFEGYLTRQAQFEDAPVDMIDHVLRCKKWFIEIDEHDQRERRLLNFGHTFGHALESAVDHRLTHGLGVAVGVLCASAHPAAYRGPDVDRLEAHCRMLLETAPGVAEALSGFDVAAFERAFRADKKHSSELFRLILPAPAGGVAEVELDNGPEQWSVVRDVTLHILETLTGRSA